MKTEKQHQAHNLFFQTNLSQVQIAKLLDVDRKTIHNWASEGNWRQQKRLAAHMPSKIAEQIYYMLANLNNEILTRSHQPYPLTHEAEQIRKMAISLRHLKNRQTVNESMEAYTLLAERISHKDPELAAKLNPYIQEMISDRVDLKFVELFSSNYAVNPTLDQFPEYLTRPADEDDPSVDIDAVKAGIAAVGTALDPDQAEAEPVTQPCVTSPAPSEACPGTSGRAGVRLPTPDSEFSEEECLSAKEVAAEIEKLIASTDPAFLTEHALQSIRNIKDNISRFRSDNDDHEGTAPVPTAPMPTPPPPALIAA